MSIGFSKNDYLRAVSHYERAWQATDHALYELCHRHPGHKDEGGLNAKLWIIGRTYATGIERKIPTKGTQGSSMSQLAQYILGRHAEVEAIFAPLEQLAEPLRAEMLPIIITQHGKFVRFLQPMTRKSQPPRSFASKYMHFHCPAVPILDSFAYRAIHQIQRWDDAFQLFPLPAGADEEYGWYVLRFWQLHQQAQAAGLRPTVKFLDYYLCCVAEGMA